MSLTKRYMESQWDRPIGINTYNEEDTFDDDEKHLQKLISSEINGILENSSFSFEQVTALNELAQSMFDLGRRYERVQIPKRYPARASNGKQLIGASTRARIAKEIDEENRAESSALLSAYGSKGGFKRHEKTAEFKKWAIKEAKNMRGSDKEIARKLSAQIPAHLADASVDPLRLIYDTLRKMVDDNYLGRLTTTMLAG
jgi:hypothetical protein